MTATVEPHPTVSTLGLRIRQKREHLGITQVALAAQVNKRGVYCSQPRLSQLETGLDGRGQEVEVSILVAFADVLKTSTDWLLGRTDDPRPPKKPRRHR